MTKKYPQLFAGLGKLKMDYSIMLENQLPLNPKMCTCPSHKTCKRRAGENGRIRCDCSCNGAD